MASRIFICSVGLLFIEDIIYILIRNSADLHRTLVQYINRRHKPSLVRKIGSQFTWIKAQRLHIVWRDRFSENLSSRSEKSSLNSYCESIDDATDDLKHSMQWKIKVEELEKELVNLQSQVAKILISQESKLQYIDGTSEPHNNSLESLVSSSTSIMTPLPPPPPPPLPPSPFILAKPILVKVKPKQVNPEENTICNIMEELSKRPPKLRHVQLSPGGRPLRSFPVDTDPSDDLTAILRKRFEAFHSPKQHSFEAEDSPMPPFGY